MKKIYFDKLVSLVVAPQDKETIVLVNGVKFVYAVGALFEKEQTITVSQAKELEAKYPKQADGQLSKEDYNKLQEKVAEYEVLKPVVLEIEGINIFEKITGFL